MSRLDAVCVNLKMVVSELAPRGDLKSILLNYLESFGGQFLRNYALGIAIHRNDGSRLSNVPLGAWSDDRSWLSKL
jgi:hypothetical protein